MFRGLDLLDQHHRTGEALDESRNCYNRARRELRDMLKDMRNDRIKCAPPRIATRDTRRVLPPPKIRASIYGTAEFAEWRAAVIRRSGGFCQSPTCANRLRKTRLYADHVVELRDGGQPFDLANGQALCGSCHQAKTLASRAVRMGLR